MSFLFGVHGRLPTADELSAIESRLSVNELWKTTVLPVVDGFTVGVGFPVNSQHMMGTHLDDQTFVAVAGDPKLKGMRVTADEIARLHHSGRLQQLHAAEGSYAVAILDRLAGRVLVFTDPLRTTPLDYSSSGSHLAFGPDASTVLWLSAEKRRLCRESSLLFLTNRYLLGNRTLFVNVSRLCPGEMIKYDISQKRLVSIQYWDMAFESTITKQSDAATTLYETLHHTHRSMAAELEPDDQYSIFLTGGMDSRGTLAFMDLLGRKPNLALTWGRNGDIPGSDPAIARELASAFGVPYEFCPIDGQEWTRHAKVWVELGELQTDNGNSYTTPLDYFTGRMNPSTKFYVLGDEMFGAGPIPLSIDSAIDNIFRTALRSPSSVLSQILKPDSCRDVTSAFNRDIRSLVDRGPNDDPKDVQDYLYFHAYIACWILAPGNFKLPVVPVRRPMLTLQVADCVRALSASLRVDKHAYVAMLRKYFPKVANFPATTTDAGVQWGSLLKTSQSFQSTVGQLVQTDRLIQLPFADDLDLERTRQFYRSVFESSEETRQRFRKLKRTVYNLRKLTGKARLIAAIAPKIQPLVMRFLGDTNSDRNMQRHQLAMRLALLVLLHEETCC